MKDLERLFERIEYELLSGGLSGEITSIVYDTRKVEQGCLFVALKGANFDSHTAVGEVIEKGASVVVIEDVSALSGVAGSDDCTGESESDICASGLFDESERDICTSAPFQVHGADISFEDTRVTVVQVPSTRRALAELSAAYFDYPADTLKVIGITGTKGKTTTTYMVKSILENAGYAVGLIGTIETIIADKHIPAKNTTPESYELERSFREMLNEGITVCVMEVSSQGLMMHRVGGFTFEIGVFTNIEPDHIGPNEHKDFDDYLNCKSRLFTQCRKGILNADDAHLDDILKGHTCDVVTYGISSDADYRATDIRLTNEKGVMGVAYTADVRENDNSSDRRMIEVEVPVPGVFSVYNSLCALAICLHFGVSDEQIKSALHQAGVKGRIELVPISDEYTLMIDYAHNAMSLESLLVGLKEYKPNRIVTLFGCGGNRDRNRRFEMGEVSGRLSDFTIITSDNPRFEEPQAILDDIETGINKTDGKYIKIIDRKEAIRFAIENAKPGDCIVLAGKGHEDYQEICGVKHPMDERVLIAEVLDEIR